MSPGRRGLTGNAPSARLFKRPDDFENAASCTRAQVDSEAFGTVKLAAKERGGISSPALFANARRPLHHSRQ
jgi:hypothetical protein